MVSTRSSEGLTPEQLARNAVHRRALEAVPAIKLFWSVTVYDADTRALILNDQQIADRSSCMDLRTNDDGSVDIYCGPKPPDPDG
jgi:hypothetical protein